jgi:O-antigen/teichoic acid export membrane protein
VTPSRFDLKNRDLADIARGALALLAGFAGRSVARILFLFFAGNFYGAARLGEMASVIAVVEILIMVGIFGFRRSLMEILESAKDDAGRLYALILSALTVTAAIGTVLAAALALVWDYIGLNMKTAHYPLLAFIIPFIGLMEIFLTATRFKRRMRYEVLARSVVEPWTLALLTLAFYFAGNTAFGLLGSYAGSLMAAFAFSLYAFGREYEWRALFAAPFNMAFIRRVGFFSGPTAVVDAIGIAFRRADIIFLSLFTPDATVGIYYGVQNLATIVQKTRHMFDPMLSPVVSQTLSRRGSEGASEQLAQVCRWIFTLLCLQLALLAFYGKPLLTLIGPGFEAGARALVIVLGAEALEGTLASAELPFVFRRPWLNLGMTASGFTAHLIGLSLLVPRFGMAGAATSFLIAITLLNGARLVAVWRVFQIKLLGLAYFKPILAGAGAFLALLYTGQVLELTRPWLVPLGLALGIGVFAGLVFVLRPTAADREFVAYLRARKKPAGFVVDKDFDQV